MKYLLDVNALMALAILDHEFHQRVARWVEGLALKGEFELVTCSITEIGVVRIVAQNPLYGFTTLDAKDLLLRLKARYSGMFAFVADDQDISRLPGWVKHPKQVTDGHLLRLAKAKGAMLATLDKRIPGAYLIPEE